MTKLKLPDPSKFTREQLAQRWKCDLSRIDVYIEDGWLKRGFDTTKVDWTDLRELDYYKSNPDDKQLLDAIRHNEPLSVFVSSAIQGQLVSCPPYLYMPVARNSIMHPGLRKIQSTLELYGAPDEMYSEPYVMVRYFYDLHGNALIPMSKGSGFIEFPIVKHEFDLLPIPLEEVERFEGLGSETGVDRVDKKTRSVSVEREGKKAEKGLEDSDLPPVAKTTDNTPADKRPPFSDSFLRLSEVRRRVGFSSTKIYQLIKDGMFPKQVKVFGGRDSRWLESDINAWIEETKRASN